MREPLDGKESAEQTGTRMKRLSATPMRACANNTQFECMAWTIAWPDKSNAIDHVFLVFVGSSNWARGVVASRLDTRSLALVSNALCLSETRETYVAAVSSDSTSRRP